MAISEGIHTGVFELWNSRKVFGSLEVAGRNSTLTIHDENNLPPVPGAYRTLHGTLHGGDRVSLINCVLLSIVRAHGQNRYTAKIFPNTIVIGPRQIGEEDPEVIRLAFSFGDASSVFYNFDAFSGVFDSRPFLPLLVADKERIRIPVMGADPIIGYFNGRFEIASAKTTFGDVTTRYRVSESMGGPNGWSVSGEIWISVEFGSPLILSDAMSRAWVLIRFFELICGRRQGLRGVEVGLASQVDRERAVDVYEVHATRLSDIADSKLDGRRKPGPRDVLICTADGDDSYATVLRKYLETDSELFDARGRLRDGLCKGSVYTIDRIIAAANMFDILPPSACPRDVEVPDDLEKAKIAARDVFKKLPSSIERDSVLGALGRIGKANLKQKVLYRMRTARLDHHFEGLDSVLQEAVNCRNHYVHGSPAVIDYSRNFEVVTFFTAALEFVFGVSDLVECGWDLSNWMAGSPQADHPFGEFVVSYRERFEHFKLLASNAISDPVERNENCGALGGGADASGALHLR